MENMKTTALTEKAHVLATEEVSVVEKGTSVIEKGTSVVEKGTSVVENGKPAVTTGTKMVFDVLECKVKVPVSSNPKDGVKTKEVVVPVEVCNLATKAFNVVDFSTTTQKRGFTLSDGKYVTLCPTAIPLVAFVPTLDMEQEIVKVANIYENILVVYSYGTFECGVDLSKAEKVVKIVSTCNEETVLMACYTKEIPEGLVKNSSLRFGAGCRLACSVSDLFGGVEGLVHATYGDGGQDTVRYNQKRLLSDALVAVKSKMVSSGGTISDEAFFDALVIAVDKKVIPTANPDSLVHFWR